MLLKSMVNLDSIKIAIIEDNGMVSKGMKGQLLSNSGIIFETVFELKSLIDFAWLDTSIIQVPDIVLLGVRLEEISVLKGISKIYSSFPDSSIIIIAEVRDINMVMSCIKAGAKGFMSKDFGQQELICSVKSVIQGGSFVSPGITRAIFDHIRERNNRVEDLTGRQQEIVRGILGGLSYKLIAYELGISIDTVREHVKNVYKKLNINSKGELVALLKF
jgi:DNA-binding NarL/FixJ family response regulator